MKFESRIIIDPTDASSLLSDINELSGFFGPDDFADLKKRCPALMRLKSMLEGVVIGEPRQRVYDKLESAEKKTRKSKPRLRAVSKSRER